MSKSAEPRAEQQARLIAMPRRESFSASAKERRAEKAFQRQQKSAVFSRLRCKVMKNNTGRQFSGHRVDTSKQKVDTSKQKVDTPNPKSGLPNPKSGLQKTKSGLQNAKSGVEPPQKSTKKRGIPLIREVHLLLYLTQLSEVIIPNV